MSTKVLLAGLVSGITGFLLGWVVYGMLLADFTAEHTIKYEGLMKEPPVLWAIFLSNTAWGILYAHIFNRWGGIQSFGSGFSSGFLISLLIAVSIDLFYYAFMNMNDGMYLCVDALVTTIMGAIMAGIAAAMLGIGKAKS
ncbi:MAG: hypothetical protein IPJ86_04980 [Bacteroidetes bacterium]|jgi:hypothetical protein|nr:hypothetical protein [Bacteroidota bacterium]MBK9319094.1 hypothetical protein [Bacteroidota bacterium]